MTNGIFEKIYAGGVLAPTDLTADDKKRLYAVMVQKGASEAFAYTRFFRDGFAAWEVDGIWNAKIYYLQTLLNEKVEVNIKGDNLAHYSVEGVEKTFNLNTPGDFWRFLGDIKKRVHFGIYMASLGMLSQTTVSKRFNRDDWKDYELVGVRQIITDYTNDRSRPGNTD